jgi:hypothetical protein
MSLTQNLNGMGLLKLNRESFLPYLHPPPPYFPFLYPLSANTSFFPFTVKTTNLPILQMAQFYNTVQSICLRGN